MSLSRGAVGTSVIVAFPSHTHLLFIALRNAHLYR